jgi:hypothetical protein
MEKHLFILSLFVLAFIALIIFLIKRNHKDRKSLFKKMPGDLPDPPMIKSEFDSVDK